ncbi:efflux RND transporter periplasmic adaptor subunit [Cognatishimia sp. SS12]|uniref:efflux RND transporter periplasmic adaptor subunit n=1 Tax=Cognatishimia sp. SS12 TaxID=2979465 RepID=UPI00232B7F84|nr:efflux RND transporter periplasmic adaptor subunit [Cognatishimia sp. SS12]MDC0738544.1 efflux RND transporter periplasmic adaptor subunit [Cognatishimia sp. SS12]
MRIIPLVIAVLVSAFMYLFIIERDTLLALASTDDTAAQSETAGAAPGNDEGDGASKELVRVVALRSEARTIDSAVIVRGETEAERQIDVMAETSGLVVSTPLRKGTFVQKDQILCEIDPGTRGSSLNEAQARLAEARAGVPAAQARLEEAKARLEEAMINDNAASKLSQGGFASDTRVASAQANVRAAEAAVASATSGLESAHAAIQSAEARVASAQKEIDRLTVRAPFAGLLETDTAEFGALLQAQGPSGAHCATIIELNPIKLVGFVPETEVNQVELGALAGARLASGEEVRGTVSFISRAADPATRTFRVEVDVPNPDLRIRDGQTAEILIAAEGKSAHLVPQSALTLNNEGRIGVRVVSDTSQAEFVEVVVLRDTVDGIWVTGLPDKADVIVIGQEYVVSGVQVEASYQEHNE